MGQGSGWQKTPRQAGKNSSPILGGGGVSAHPPQQKTDSEVHEIINIWNIFPFFVKNFPELLNLKRLTLFTPFYHAGYSSSYFKNWYEIFFKKAVKKASQVIKTDLYTKETFIGTIKKEAKTSFKWTVTAYIIL